MISESFRDINKNIQQKRLSLDFHLIPDHSLAFFLVNNWRTKIRETFEGHWSRESFLDVDLRK
jgi:hypothetical protein